MRRLLPLLAAALLTAGCASVRPYGPLPTPQQVAWQRMEMNMFCHFGPNTFTDLEWGEGTEAEDLFNPTALDCGQWAATAKAAGFGGIILTAKHHDGFCLWPNPASSHTVRQSAWRGGEGDVLRELSEACRSHGVKFGIYISPWDRNASTYGTPAYNETFRQTLQSALSHYGPVFEQWFDGACGEGPNGKRQIYDWDLFNATVAELQPQAVIFSDVGPGCRWMGNERGVNGRTCWSALDTEGFHPGQSSPSQDTLNRGNRHGRRWVPAETDVSLRPGWFYHSDESPKPLQQLLGIYYTSVGRNSLLLLNVPPDRRGLIAQADSLRLMELRAALDAIFARDLAQGANVEASRSVRGHGPACVTDTAYHTYWAPSRRGSAQPRLTLAFPAAVTFNRVMLQEYIPLGQRVERFAVEAMDAAGAWRTVAEETTIGFKRIVLLDQTVTTERLRITFVAPDGQPLINRVALYQDDIFQGTIE